MAVATGWHAVAVNIAHGEDPEASVNALRRLERWFAENHRPIPFFKPDGSPKSSMVCLAVRVEEAQKALAFRTLCRELGLANGLVQWRIGPCNVTPPKEAGWH